MYNVLWIDDEWQKQDAFIPLCQMKYDVCIRPFEFVKDGLKELEAHLLNWDAVILDAKVKMSENDVPNLEGLQKAVLKIEEFGKKHPLPYFISTGQPDLVDADYFKQIYRTFYVKATDDDRLMKDVIEKIRECATPEFRVRNKYPEELEAARLIAGAEEILLKGLRCELADRESDEETLNNFNEIRKICEKLINECGKSKYIPYFRSLSAVCDFLNGKDVGGFKLNRPIMHKTLIGSLSYVLSITQDGSHDKNDLSLGVADYVRERNSNNLYKSVLHIVMDLLVWYKNLKASGPAPSDLWTGQYEAEGEILLISDSIGHPRPVVNGKYQLQGDSLPEGTKVVILNSEENKHDFGAVDRYVRMGDYKIV